MPNGIKLGGGSAKFEGNATPSQVLSGATFYSSNKELKTGSMTNRGAVTQTLDAGGSYTIPAGYHNGSGKVTANSLASQTDGTATASQILTGQTAYVDGAKVTGTMTNRGAVSQTLAINGTYAIPAGYHNGSGKVTQSITTLGATTYTPTTSNQTIASGRYLSGAQTIKGDANLVAANIVSGKSIFGVAGSAKTADSFLTSGLMTSATLTKEISTVSSHTISGAGEYFVILFGAGGNGGGSVYPRYNGSGGGGGGYVKTAYIFCSSSFTVNVTQVGVGLDTIATVNGITMTAAKGNDGDTRTAGSTNANGGAGGSGGGGGKVYNETGFTANGGTGQFGNNGGAGNKNGTTCQAGVGFKYGSLLGHTSGGEPSNEGAGNGGGGGGGVVGAGGMGCMYSAYLGGGGGGGYGKGGDANSNTVSALAGGYGAGGAGGGYYNTSNLAGGSGGGGIVVVYKITKNSSLPYII